MTSRYLERKKLEYMRGYIAMQEDFQDKLQKQLIGKVYAEQELLKYKKRVKTIPKILLSYCISN